ncbi:MAG: hypothetical protein JWM36_4848 [Hyphomicrobiales bacterium]|nr:hypothetical protein [Hyphomicrobiales bacterium]
MTAAAAPTDEPDDQVSRVNVPLGLILLAGAVTALAGFWQHDVSDEIRGNALAVTCVGVAGGLFITRRTGLMAGMAAGHVGPWASLSFALVFGLGSLQWTAPQLNGFAAVIAPENVAKALELLTFAWGAWVLGYLTDVLKFAQRPATWLVDLAMRPESAGYRWRTSGVWWLLALGLVGQALRVRTNTFGYVTDVSASLTSFSSLGQIVSVLSNMGLFAVVLAAVKYFSPERRGRLAPLVVVSTVQVLLALAQGLKEGVAVVAVAIILSYGLVRGRVPVRMIVVASLLFAFAVLPVVTSYRVTVRGGGAVPSVGEAIALLPDVAANALGSRTASQNSEQLASRLRVVDSLAVVIQKSPDVVPYAPLSDLVVQPVVGLVPRALWPGKPGFTGGYDFGRIYYNAPSNFYSAWAATPPADLYRRGGTAILILGMLLLGGLYRLFDTVLRPQTDIRHLFLIVALFPVLVKHEIDVGSLLLTLPVSLIGVAIAVRALGLVGEHEQG